MNSTKSGLTFVLLLTSITLDAFAQQSLTNVDLTAAYCLRLTQSGLERTKITDFPNDPASVKAFHEAQEQGKERVTHLQKYLASRSIPLDRTELVIAMKTADADLAAAYAQAEKCAKSANPDEPPWKNGVLACSRNFDGAPRMATCRELNFIPE